MTVGMEWNGNIWLNPPYSSVSSFVEKLCKSENVERAIVLVNNATETQWFRQLSERAAAIVFHTGRLPFEKDGGETSKPMQGQAFVYVGNYAEQFLEEFGKYGWGAKL